MRAVAIGYGQTLSGLATVPDQTGQPTGRDAPKSGITSNMSLLTWGSPRRWISSPTGACIASMPSAHGPISYTARATPRATRHETFGIRVKGPDSPTGRALGQSHHSTEVF